MKTGVPFCTQEYRIAHIIFMVHVSSSNVSGMQLSNKIFYIFPDDLSLDSQPFCGRNSLL